MTHEQIMGLTRQVLQVVGVLATALGWSSPEAWAGLTTQILAVVGPLATLGAIAWELLTNRTATLVTKVANLPEVEKVKLDPAAPAAASIAGATPNNVTLA